MSARPADLVFVNGPVHTVDAARSWSDGVAVRNGVIAALGGAAVRELTGPDTVVVDLAGRLLLPGFVDAHVHPVMGGIERARCDLSGADSAADCLRIIAEYAAANPELPWILGGGWSMDHFPGGTPSRHDLDTVVADRPVYLLNRDHHDAWVNTRALDLSRVDRDTPDPEHGRISREPDGSPQGSLHESATLLVGRHAPTTTHAELVAGLLSGQRHLHSVGVTGWQDAIVGPYLGYPDTLDAYVELAAEQRLTGRVTGALWWDRDRGAEQIDELKARRKAAGDGRFRATTVKIMQDGICENLTAAMLTPYLGTADSGHSHIDPAALKEYVTRLDAEGFQTHVHAIGDRGVREALDAFAAARATNGPSGNRHHIAHIQVVHPDDIPRFRELGVAVNMQPLWAAEDASMRELTLPLLGEARWQWQYPFGAIRATGAVLAAGSDWPVSSAHPLEGIHVAVNRVAPGARDAAFLPDQRLALGDAIAAYTIGSAWVNGREDSTGSIEIGKQADLVVLDRDPFRGEPGEIASTRVDQTYVAGQRVHG